MFNYIWVLKRLNNFFQSPQIKAKSAHELPLSFQIYWDGIQREIYENASFV